MTLQSRIDRFNQQHPWSHNNFYGDWVVKQVASSRARDILDIGCGTGDLIARLQRRDRSVTGFEPDPAAARVAMARFADSDSVIIKQIGFEQRDPDRWWDAITLVASLHHLPLADTMRDLNDCLRPGGRLVVIGCYRAAGTVDSVTTAVAVPTNMVMGLVKHPCMADRLPACMTAPTAAPRETLDEIRAEATEHLPGAKIRRRLFWRYSLVYDKPVVA
ncbi:class I SAM-dependent methyltransferase [Nocardia sp. NPDC051570]|uniref:class I SAM-dependent methyltransferase n=1 Tax=Nocardia sp. NPDC051570 TaxID=3364324 RepID=UPI00379AA694